MRPRKKITSRRCGECQRWFPPEPRAVKTQQTCSQACRLARRARQGRDQRGKDLEGFRLRERERQRRCREKKSAAGPAPPGSELPEALQREVQAALELALGARRPSRAALTDALTRLAREALQRPAGP